MSVYSKLTDEMEELFKDPKMSNPRIADKLGLSVGAVTSRRSRLGFERAKIFPSCHKDIVKKFKQGATVEQLKEEYDASTQWITRALYAAGLVFRKHRNGSKGTIKEVYAFPPEHWFPYNLLLDKEIRESAEFYKVSTQKYKKWIKETPEGRRYFTLIQGREHEEGAKRLRPIFSKANQALQQI